MMRLATETDIPVLKKIWDQSFDDTVNYIDFVFDQVATPREALLYETDNRIVAMLLMVQTKFVYRGEAVDATYILGAATLKKYQGRGLMSKLLLECEDRARKNGSQLCILVPGERYLFDFYKKRGYHADFFMRSLALTPQMLDGGENAESRIENNTIRPDELFYIREKALHDTHHIAWQASQIPFVIEDSLIYGDQIASYDGPEGKSYAFYSKHRRQLYIKECLGTTPLSQRILLKQLMIAENPRKARINLPVNYPLFAHEGKLVEYGMAKPLNVKVTLRYLDPYMNLMLD